MNKYDILGKLAGGLIVSCQALEDEPLHSSYIMSRMAVAAKMGGACGIRANSPKDIRAIKKAVDLPVIGLVKKKYEGFAPYITPTLKEVEAVVKAGAEIVAVDATFSLKPGKKTTAEFIKSIKERFDIIVMGDISTYEEGMEAEAAGVDIVSTTLSGYTENSPKSEEPDFELVSKLHRDLKIPVIAEGRIWHHDQARKALDSGAFAVVVGSAITRPQLIAQRFADALKAGRRADCSEKPADNK